MSQVAHAQIWWQSLPYRTYTVWRAEVIEDGFTQISGDLIGTPPTNTYPDVTATNADYYFYQVRIRD